jgi:selenocysteine-specific elongation factor
VHVVATAGHVDHGKSTLVLAMTGTDPDRFAEEKARGLTIDLGFAWTTLPSGRELAFVDVPGHVRFLKNMLAGVGAVEACLFVVAATEGWKPQSEEHLRILQLLGVGHGVVAVTKAGLVDGERLGAVLAAVGERVAGTFLADAEVVALDAVTGDGLDGADGLRGALDRLLDRVPVAADRGRPRLWVDRSFAAKGAGTVVTGTLAGGSLAVGDEVLLVPGGAVARVRGLQSHKAAVERAGPGRRLAVNLVGVAHGDVARGHAVVRPGQWAPTTTVDCSLSVLPSLDHAVSRRGAFHASIGSGEHPVALRVLGGEAIEPGTAGLVRLHLPAGRPVPLLPGDRYVLRDSGRAETVGGGEVLDVAPVLPASRAQPSRSVERVVAERGWVEADLLERLTGERRPPTVGRWVVAPEAWAAVAERVRAAVAAAGPLGLDVARLDERERSAVERLDGVVVADGRARPAEAEDPLARHPYLAALAAAPFSPPPPEGVDRAELRELVRRGLAVERDGVYFAPAAVEEAARLVARLLAVSPEGVTASAVREALATSRKYVLPLLGHLDATGMTRRRGDVRVAGPRLPNSAGGDSAFRPPS